MASALTLPTLPTSTLTTPAPPVAPVAALTIVARAGGDGLPAYVTADQARAVVDAAETTQHRLLLECLWQTGGRVSEVLRLRRCDVDPTEGAVQLVNLKQRRRDKARKLVYVSSGLVAQLLAYCRDAKLPMTGYLFSSRQSGGAPMARQHAWRLVTRYAQAAGVLVVDTATGQERPATGLDFRHGAAVHQLRAARAPLRSAGPARARADRHDDDLYPPDECGAAPLRGTGRLVTPAVGVGRRGATAGVLSRCTEWRPEHHRWNRRAARRTRSLSRPRPVPAWRATPGRPPSSP
jgi:hypothetical protein